MLYLAFLVVLTIANTKNQGWSPNTGRDLIVDLPYLTTSPNIDGIIQEEEYSTAKKLSNFTEFIPREKAEPAVKTEVYVGFDDNNIYIAFKCYENDPTELRANYTGRDKCFMDDVVIIYLDTYNDLKDAYIFIANPKGVQMDGIRKKDEGGEDYTYDTEWNISAKIEEGFWTAEFQIPFSSLNFSKKPQKKWRVEFGRSRPRETMEMYTWAPLSKDNPGMLSQSGTFIINTGGRLGGKKFTFIPYISSAQGGMRELDEYGQGKVDYKGGLSLRYAPFSNAVVDMAVNPDFAEIEADAPELDINTPYAIYYSEKRPFFQEGKSLLETPLDIVYTRNINNPVYAVKVRGNVMGNDFVLLSAKDNNTPWIIPFEDFSGVISSSEPSFSNIVRAERNVLENTQIGFIAANRIAGEGFNTVYGLDVRSKLFDHYTVSYQGSYTDTKEPSDSTLSQSINWATFEGHTGKFDGERFDGHAHYLNSNVYFRNFSGGLDYEIISPEFRSDLGFIQQNNVKEGNIYIQPKIYPNKFGFNEASLYLGYGSERNFNNTKKSEGTYASLNLDLLKQTSVSLSYNRSGERYFDEYFSGLWNYGFSFGTSPLKYLSFNSYFGFGKTINYSESEYGYERNLSLFTSLNPFAFINVEVAYQKYWLFRKQWEENVYDVTLLHSKIEYFFSRLFSLRIGVDYNKLSKNLNVMPLIKYQPSPFTIFFIGMNSSFLCNDFRDYEIQDHQCFLKVQYRFNL